VTTLDPATMRPVDRYRMLINGIVPRPIAWVTTVDAAGIVNLAPFSFFSGVTANPPILQISIAHRAPLKDTLRNLRSTGVAVVHLVPGKLLEAMQASSAEYPPEVSEAAALGLAQHPAERVSGVVLTDAELAFECRMVQEIPVGDPPTSLCLLEVVLAHVAPAVAQPDGLPDLQRMRAVARLGGDAYLLPEAWAIRELARPRLPR
jgi:flavin reductase (DIM6/NTAB) family NADH-FMN oxidoreductase RutF